LAKNLFELKSISDLKDYTFTVERYQRGYKWEINQVKDLLNDINEFTPSQNGFYCLQPVVVKRIEAENTTKKKFELIDGQQRCTTLYIIQSVLNQTTSNNDEKSYYNIEYRTRVASEYFLKTISSLSTYLNETDSLDKNRLNELWNDYCMKYPQNNNVDNYHFFIAYWVVSIWINKLSENQFDSFRNKLLYKTKVIWYEINSKESPESIFINFNQGKIELAQAELIKALFVLELKTEPNLELQALKTNQFSEEWNSIEIKLQDNDFWYFISNDTSDKRQANRIDLLFDIANGKASNDRDILFSYRKYLKKFIQSSNSTIRKNDPLHWGEIKNTYDILLEWYDDRELYHLIGFLIQEKLISIKKLLAYYEKANTKKQFRELLTSLIKDKYFDNDTYLLDTLGYYKPYETRSILILFNILLYQNSDFSYRFPFSLFKNTSWSLEHIHAQKSKKFTIVHEIKEWIKDLKRLSDDYGRDNERLTIIFEKIEKLISPLNNQDHIPKDVRLLLDELEELTDNEFDKDSFNNLCLLDSISNSHFNNDNFSSKRQKLINIDSGRFTNDKGEIIKAFIPLGTKYVFLKYFNSDNTSFQITHWGNEDRKKYAKFIIEIFSDYFNLKIVENEQ
jgi:uncharacterized protein with ParB-like and HNH nuclease domain